MPKQTLPVIVMQDNTEPATALGFGIRYIAGLFDGDGCIFLNRAMPTEKTIARGEVSPKYQLMCSLANIYKPVVLKFQAKFGGLVVPRNAQNPRQRTAWYWAVTARRSVNFLEKISPYLFIKKEQAKIALDYHRTCIRDVYIGGKGGNPPLSIDEIAMRERYFLMLQMAKRREWPVI